MIKKQLIAQKNENLIRILQDCGMSYADASKILKQRDVKVNGKAVNKDNLVSVGDEIIFFCKPEVFEKKFEKIFENNEVAVIYKRVGIESEGMLEEVLGAIAVHRLDRNTEGLMVYAKNEKSAQKLMSAIKDHKMHKFYVAEVVGHFQTDRTYDAYLSKDSEKSQVTINQSQKKGAVAISTGIKTLKAGNETSLLEIELHTGKTHQIRAHLAFLGHPIVGDGKYGRNEINKKFNQKWQKLACFRLKFDFVGVEGLDFQQFEKFPDFMNSQ